MRILKHLSKALFLLLILALALYGLYYYQVKRSVDRQLQEMGPFVDAQYDSLYVNPLGEITLNTVAVNLMGQSGIIIDSISLKSDPLFFLQFESRVNQGDWPDSLTLAIEGLNVDFNMPLFLMMEQFATNDSEGVQLAALGCGRVTQFDMSALRMMGMRQGRFDFFLNLRGRDMGPLNLQLLTNMQGWGELLLDVDVGGNVGLGNLTAAPSLQRVSFSLRDTGFNQRRNQFCSMQSGLSLAEYRQEHQSLVNDWVAQTMIPVPENLISAYHQLAEPGASFSIQLNTEGLNQSDLLSPDQLFERLSQQLSVTINNQVQVIDAESANLMLALIQQPVVLSSEDVSEPVEVDPSLPRSMPGVASPPAQTVQSAVPRRYQQTSPEDLVNYVGHPVRFFTSFGKRVDGVLVSVEGSTVRVAERVQHGVAQYPVELDTIQGTEVYR
ncbi:hypothetical protein [Nitrincola schmidtii]|uniref:hypothetical protein n=1 Tax=Nitrincola schmidtii TaxID=1730894 RepID=UPI00124DD61E|nr:hypothetical protein [Nitrincola schmidtii]